MDVGYRNAVIAAQLEQLQAALGDKVQIDSWNAIAVTMSEVFSEGFNHGVSFTNAMRNIQDIIERG